MKEAISIKKVMSSIFVRKGPETERTKLFDNLTEDIQAKLLESISLRSDELAVIAYLQEDSDWLLITTERILCRQSSRICSIDLDRLKDVTVALVEDAAKGARGKDDLTFLKIVLKAGEEQIIETESGKPYFGIWNMLNFFVRREMSS